MIAQYYIIFVPESKATRTTDATKCCRRKGVPSECIGLCRNTYGRDYMGLQMPFCDCTRYLETTMACLRNGSDEVKGNNTVNIC